MNTANKAKRLGLMRISTLRRSRRDTSSPASSPASAHPSPSPASAHPPPSPASAPPPQPRTTIPAADIRERIKNIPIFADIRDNEEAISQVMDITTVSSVSRGTNITEEGSLGSAMYILLSGEVEIKKITRAGDQYTIIRLHADRNVFFGELALVDNDRRSASVITTTDCMLLKITEKDFDTLSARSPHIALPIIKAIARILGGRLRKTTSDMLTIFDALVQELSE